MVNQICFTGSRKLTSNAKEQVLHRLSKMRDREAPWHVGDAFGVDKTVIDFAEKYCKEYTLYSREGNQKYHFAQRSKRMILSAREAASDGEVILIAFPDKPCPINCSPAKPFSGSGSGTWETIAFARSFQITVAVFSLYPEWRGETPDWVFDTQLSLF